MLLIVNRWRKSVRGWVGRDTTIKFGQKWLHCLIYREDWFTDAEDIQVSSLLSRSTLSFF